MQKSNDETRTTMDHMRQHHGFFRQYMQLAEKVSLSPISFFQNSIKVMLASLALLTTSPLLQAQDITFSEASLELDAFVDDNDYLEFQFSNTSADDLTISGITITGEDAGDFDFSLDNGQGQGGQGQFPNTVDFPYIMPIDGLESSLMAVVFFAPTSAGTKLATLNVFSDSPESPHTINIVGTSTILLEPEMEISLANQPSGGTVFDLLSINVGEPDTITATISNLGNKDLIISNLELSGGSTQFQFVPNFTLPLVIAPQNSVVIDIQAVATYPVSIPSPGIISIGSSFTITHDDPNQTNPRSTYLKFFERAPDPVTNVSELDFGNVPTETDKTLSFTITNQSINPKTDGDLILTGFDFGVEADLFSSTSVFPITLAIGESTSLNLTFSPDEYETINTTITVLGNVNKSLAVLGKGAIKLIDIGAGTMDFGSVHKSEGQVPATFDISAIGGQDVSILSATFGGTNANNFETFGGFPRTVSGNSTFLLSFFPGASGPGPKNATITLYTDAINSPHSVEITADAIYPPILTAPSSITLDADRLIETDTTFIVKNTGTETLNITSYSFSAASSPLGISFVDFPSSFPLTLNGGEELPITVKFSPTELDDLYAEVNIVSPNNTSPSGTLSVVPILADVIFPISYISNEYSLPLDSLRFGGVSTALGKTDSLNVVNEGTADLIITDILFSGLAAGDYTIPGVSYPITIAANDSSNIPVQFAPPVALYRPATLTMVSNNVPANPTVGLSGKGTSPVLSFSSSISVGYARVGTSSSFTQEIENTGDVPALINGFELSGDSPSLFEVSGIETPMILEVGETTSIDITFSPLTAGGFTAQLEMMSDAVNGPLISTLSATGFDAPVFYIEDPNVIEDGVIIGTQKIIKIGVENRGNLDLNLISAGFDLGSSGMFSSRVNGFGLPLTVPPGGVDSLEVLYAPSVSGTHESVLSIETNDDFASEDDPTNWARINLTGIASGPEPVYSVAELDFDSTFIGFDKKISFKVTNEGVSDLHMDFMYPHPDSLFTVYYVGYDAPPNIEAFIPLTVAPGASQTIQVVFKPVAIGPISHSISLVLRNAKNQRYYEKIPVKGIGVEPPMVKIGALTIVGDDFERDGNIKRLIGNVHVGDLQLGEEVDVHLVNNTLEGDGNVYVTEVPPNGSLAGGTVTLRTGGFKYYVNGTDSTLSVNKNDAKGINFFEIIGLTLDINDLTIAEGGVRAGGSFALPEIVFGADAGFNMDKVFISKESGVNIAGKFAIEAPLTVYEVFSLESVELEFDSFNDCFTGSGSISSEGATFELSIDASVVLKNGGLDGVSLEIETSPGVPLGTTGFALAGGNGSISGLQVPPVAIELGVDIVPVAPGANKVVRFNNVGFKYTFGTSLTAGGNLLIFGMDVAQAGIEGSAQGISAEAFFSLLGIFNGEARISVQPNGDKLKVSGNASLAYTIPELQAGFPDFIRGAVNEFLPITLAEVSASFNEERITGAAVFPPIPVRISATISLVGGEPKVTFGAEFTLFNNQSGNASARMINNELPYMVSHENNRVLARQNHLEGQSIIINSNMNPHGRVLDLDNTEFPFSLNENLEAVIIRVEGVNEVPSFSIVLPTGQEVNATNAFDMGYAHTVYDEKNQAHIFLTNTLPGDYLIKIEGTDEFQIDIAGAEFGPSLTLDEVIHDQSTNEVEINWQDEDLDSDASISLYYDTDQEGGDGQIIVTELSEDDGTDQYVWDASEVDNGTYYVYGVIDDGTTLPTMSYAAEPVVIGKSSAIPVPILENPVIDGSNVKLTWSATDEAHHYLVYFAKDKAVTLASTSYNAGGKISFTFPELATGRKYDFAVTAVDANRVHSNLSNNVTLNFISETENNTPSIQSNDIPDHIELGKTYETTIEATDADAADVLTYSLIDSPAGMTMTNNLIDWTPTAAQIGVNRVKVKVQDESLAADSINFTITVTDEKSSLAFISFNQSKFNGLDAKVQVSLTDPGLNQKRDVIEQHQVKAYSTADPVGTTLTVKETSANSGIFKASFGFTEGQSTEGRVGVSVADSVFVSYQDAFPVKEVIRFVLFETSVVANKYPTAVALNNTFLNKDISIDDLIGVLSTEDADDDVHNYVLVSGVGSEHNNLFKIDGQALVLKASLNNVREEFLNIRVRSVDTKNGFYEKSFVLNREQVLSVVEEKLLESVTVYPNPTSRKFFVDIESENGAITVTLLTSNGQLVRSQVFDKKWYDSKVSINVADLPKGLYFVQIEQQGQVVNKRLIKN